MNVAWAINNLPLDLVAQPPEFVCPSTIGLEGCGLDDAQRRMVQRFDPSLIDTNAFFVAKFVKRRNPDHNDSNSDETEARKIVIE